TRILCVAPARSGRERRVATGVIETSQRATPHAGWEVCPQPAYLLGVRPVRDDGVECDDMPFTQFIAVVALAPIACRGTEIVEVRRGTWRLIIVVTRRRTGTRLMSSQRGIVAPCKVGC